MESSMKNRIWVLLPLLFLATVILPSGCGLKSEEDKVSYEHAVVNKVVLISEELDSKGNPTGKTDSVLVRSLPVTSGKPALEGILDLKDGKSYNGSFLLFNESTSLQTDLTSDIDSKNNGHQFRFSTLNSKVYLTALSQDSKFENYGRTFVFKTNGTGDDSLKITLSHFESGEKTSGTFSVDFNGSFPIQVK